MPLIREFGHRSRFHPRIGLVLRLILYIPPQILINAAAMAEFPRPRFRNANSEVFSTNSRRGGERRRARLISGFSVVTISPCYGNSLAREDLIVGFIRPKSADLHHKNSTRETGFG